MVCGEFQNYNNLPGFILYLDSNLYCDMHIMTKYCDNIILLSYY